MNSLLAKRAAGVLGLVVLVAGCTTSPDPTTTGSTETTVSLQTTTTQDITTTAPAPSPTTTTTSDIDAVVGATISIQGFAFGSPVTIESGQSVIVVNLDGVGHTWTSADGVFDSGTLGPDREFEFVFTEPGEYAFFCRIHSSMTGSLTVTG